MNDPKDRSLRDQFNAKASPQRDKEVVLKGNAQRDYIPENANRSNHSPRGAVGIERYGMGGPGGTSTPGLLQKAEGRSPPGEGRAEARNFQGGEVKKKFNRTTGQERQVQSPAPSRHFEKGELTREFNRAANDPPSGGAGAGMPPRPDGPDGGPQGGAAALQPPKKEFKSFERVEAKRELGEKNAQQERGQKEFKGFTSGHDRNLDRDR